MPVTKNGSGLFGDRHMPSSHFGRKIIWTLVGILLAYMIVFFGTLIRNNIEKYHYIGRADRPERTITVEAQGKVNAAPDVAETTMGMIAEGKSVAEAQEKNTAVMNKLMGRLKDMGVASGDIRTSNYSVYPQYNYTEEKGQELVGYQVSQQVTVKIRDVSKSGAILGLAGEVGANSVSGLSFVMDDPDAYRAEARMMALRKARQKALVLSRALGVRIVNVASYTEYEGGVTPMYKAMPMEMGRGGGPAPVPDIAPGSSDVVMNVQVTYEIR